MLIQGEGIDIYILGDIINLKLVSTSEFSQNTGVHKDVAGYFQGATHSGLPRSHHLLTVAVVGVRDVATVIPARHLSLSAMDLFSTSVYLDNTARSALQSLQGRVPVSSQARQAMLVRSRLTEQGGSRRPLHSF